VSLAREDDDLDTLQSLPLFQKLMKGSR
jgi:hypothetical protein